MSNPIEPWQLTAYLLGELDSDQAALVREQLESSPELQAEMKELQSAIGKVQRVMQHRDGDQSSELLALLPKQTEIVRASMEGVSASHAKDSPVSLHSKVSLLSRQLFVSLTALAVIGILAVFIVPGRFERSELAKVANVASKAFSATGDRGAADGEADKNLPAYMDDSIVVFDPTKDVRKENTGRFMLGGSVNSDLKTESKTASAEAKGIDQPQATSFSTSLSKPAPAGPVSNPLEAIDETPAVSLPDAKVTYWADGIVSQGEATNRPSLGKPTNDAEAIDDDSRARFRSMDHFSLLGDRIASNTKLQKLETELMMNMTPRIIIPEEEEAKYLGESPARLKQQSYDRYTAVQESNFSSVLEAPLSTFSIDVDTAAYSKIRQGLMQSNVLPPPEAVRIEEMINYFDYEYAGPTDSHPFASNMVVGDCPWNNAHKLVRIGLQARKVELKDRPKANLVFLLDVSGSMDEPNKLPLVKQSIAMLVRQLGENDRISMVVYAGAAGCVLPSTTADKQGAVLAALDELNAGGSTNGGQGIELAYAMAKEHFVPGGINRVILCTDGDFNVGTTSDEALVKLVTEQAKSKVFLTCLGFGAGNYNDSMMEKISNSGNGTYAMIDNAMEGRRVLVEQVTGSLITVAKDVKIQVEFNPSHVSSYRLIGYDNRRLANQDFNDDKKDAGEIGSGHRVTALYEIVPAGAKGASAPEQDELRYGRQKTSPAAVNPSKAPPAADSKEDSPESQEWLTLKIRYKQPEGDVSSKVEFHLNSVERRSGEADRDFQWATAVAEFGLLLRRSVYAPQASWTSLLDRAKSLTGDDVYRIECLEMMNKAKALWQSNP